MVESLKKNRYDTYIRINWEKQAGGESDEKTAGRPDKRTEGAGAGTTEESSDRRMKLYMKEAIKQAKKAYAIREVPIGCVIVHEGKIIARGYNRRTIDKNPLAHAEISAIRKASKKLEDWRLEECTLYVTLEPCQMCAGAIVQAANLHGSWWGV